MLGLSIGALTSKRLAYAGLVFTVIVFLIGLVTLGLEGYICVLMTLPIVLPFMFLESIITHLIKRYDKLKITDKAPVLFLPLFIFLFGSRKKN